jgi:hypothetical protein
MSAACRVTVEIATVDKWEIRVFRQVDGMYCAIAERAEPGKRWIVNAEGKTPQEAVDKLLLCLKT